MSNNPFQPRHPVTGRFISAGRNSGAGAAGGSGGGTDLAAFAERMRQRANAVPGAMNARAVKLGQLILQTLVLATPVDTGHARNNWQVGINSVDFDEVPGEDPTGQATISAGNETIATKQPGDTIIITNNAPYIQRLNEGWSAQAPAGFIEKAVDIAVASTQNTKVIT